MSVYIRQTEDGTYELGDEINGVFVPFVSHPATWVDGIVQAAKNAESESAGQDQPGGTQHA